MLYKKAIESKLEDNLKLIANKVYFSSYHDIYL